MYSYLAQEIRGLGRYEYASSTLARDTRNGKYTKIAEHGSISIATLKEFCDGSVAMLQWLERHGAWFEESLCP